jgi:hypothetical protein
MDKTTILLILALIALVMGVGWYASIDQARLAAAQAQVGSELVRAPEGVQAAAGVAEGLLVKALAGALVTLILIGGLALYQAARIAELRGHGWERFWERRRVRRTQKQKQPSLQELLTAALVRDLTKKE